MHSAWFLDGRTLTLATFVIFYYSITFVKCVIKKGNGVSMEYNALTDKIL